MFLETLGFGTYMSNRPEGFSDSETVDKEMVVISIFYFMWIVLWISTISNAIKLAQKGGKNSQAGLIISVLSWPIYWVFKMTKAIG